MLIGRKLWRLCVACVRFKAVDELKKQSVENGLDKMDLEEVNREIQAVRMLIELRGRISEGLSLPPHNKLKKSPVLQGNRGFFLGWEERIQMNFYDWYMPRLSFNHFWQLATSDLIFILLQVKN